MTARDLPTDQLELVASLIGHVPVGVLAADDQLRCAYANDRLAAIAGQPPAALRDEGLAGVLSAVDRHRLQHACQRVVADRVEVVERVALRTPDGRDPRVEVCLTALTAADGVVRGVVGAVWETADEAATAGGGGLAPTIGYVAQLE